MIYKFTVRTRPQYLSGTDSFPAIPGIVGLQIFRDYYVETAGSLDTDRLTRLSAALHDPIVETVDVGTPLIPGRMVQVAFKHSIVDNESDTIVTLCNLLNIDAVAGKVAITYQSVDPGLLQAIRSFKCNSAIEDIHVTEPVYHSLRPSGHAEPARRFDLSKLSNTEMTKLGTADGRNLNLLQMNLIRNAQLAVGASSVTDVLLEAMDARWSDHCYHTTWRSLGGLLKILINSSKKTANPNVLSMFEDNAGVWDFYGGYGIAFKGETHNGPTAISGYFGQLTKLGGVFRDILGTGLGADPIGSFEYTATGTLSDQSCSPSRGLPASRQIALETIRAVKEYGNTFGVPMMVARMAFHPAYRAKPFAMGGSIGLMPHSAVQKGSPKPGDVVVLIGGLTGNDGIHGASASSAGSAMDLAAVQIGSPLEQVKFRQAIVDLRDAGCLRALTDVGGAGLNSAVGEIGEGCGVWLNTARVPLKTNGLAQWRILLSESQERMILAVLGEKIGQARSILDRHAVRNTVVGRFTSTHRYTVVHAPEVTETDILEFDAGNPPLVGEVGFDLPYSLLRYDPPSMSVAWPTRMVRTGTWPAITVDELPAVARLILADMEVCDQSFAGSQYDSSVQGNTFYGPYTGRQSKVPTSYWAATPLPDKPHAVVFSAGFNPWLFELDPVHALRQHFLGLVGSLVLAGVSVRDICFCDNFYTPHKACDGYGWLVAMVHELASLAERFGTPLISGKDSSAGSTETDEGLVSVPPAVFLSALGKVPDAATLLTNDWRRPGNLLVRIGPICSSTAGTAAARVLNLEPGEVDLIDLSDFQAYLTALANLPAGLLVSGRPIGAGGMFGSAVYGVLGSGIGMEFNLPDGGNFSDLFCEHRCGAMVEVRTELLTELPEQLNPVLVGRLLDSPPEAKPIIQVGGVNLLTEPAIHIWRKTFEEALRCASV